MGVLEGKRGPLAKGEMSAVFRYIERPHNSHRETGFGVCGQAMHREALTTASSSTLSSIHPPEVRGGEFHALTDIRVLSLTECREQPTKGRQWDYEI